jgi:hypothetical protein
MRCSLTLIDTEENILAELGIGLFSSDLIKELGQVEVPYHHNPSLWYRIKQVFRPTTIIGMVKLDSSRVTFAVNTVVQNFKNQSQAAHFAVLTQLKEAKEKLTAVQKARKFLADQPQEFQDTSYKVG